MLLWLALAPELLFALLVDTWAAKTGRLLSSASRVQHTFQTKQTVSKAHLLALLRGSALLTAPGNANTTRTTPALVVAHRFAF